MYELLRRFLPEGAANTIMLAWYLVLCILIYILSVEQEAGFLYQGL